MKIVDGQVIDAEGDKALAEAAWCNPNSVDELKPRHKPQEIKIKYVLDAGSYRKFKKILQARFTKAVTKGK